MKVNEQNTTCCIAGGGPAGVMLGFLLARAGIPVIVLEKHADFLRDFRGDTIHPSTIQLMAELGLLDDFLKVPHESIEQIKVVYNNRDLTIVDFSHLPVPPPKLAIMPQWDFLEFMVNKASKYAAFKLIKQAEVKNLVKENNRICGLEADTPDGQLRIRAQLIVGADGRSSDVRRLAGLKVINTGVPIDVLWFKVPFKNTDPPYTLGRFFNGQIMVLLNRGNYWQCAFVIEKDAFKEIQKNGLDNFRKSIADASPFLSDRTQELKSWDDIKLLTVTVDHLEKWYTDGLLCIGDSAHAMSSIGGVGINLALQDAVAAANILTPHLGQGLISTRFLKEVQNRREFPARVIQQIQVQLHKGIENRHKNLPQAPPPFFMSMLNAIPVLRRLPAHLIGMGIRPEHIRTPEKV